MKIIGFDCSSTTVGWGVIEYDSAFNVINIKSGWFKPIKTGTIFERLDFVRIKVKDLLETHKPDIIAIEDIVKFMAGKSSAQTIITLSVFNRTIGMTCFDYSKTSPDLLSVMTIRHKIKEAKTVPKKEEVPARLEKILGIQFNWTLNKNGKIKPESYDESDGLAVATARFIQEKTKK